MMVRLERFTNNDTLIHDITDQSGIKIFTEIIDGKQYNIIDSKEIGTILYYSKGQVVFKATMLNDGVRYVFNRKVFKEKISYQCGMYFSEVWNKK